MPDISHPVDMQRIAKQMMPESIGFLNHYLAMNLSKDDIWSFCLKETPFIS